MWNKTAAISVIMMAATACAPLVDFTTLDATPGRAPVEPVSVAFNNPWFESSRGDGSAMLTIRLPRFYQLALRDGLTLGQYSRTQVNVHLSPNIPVILVVRDPAGNELPGFIVWHNSKPVNGIDRLGELEQEWLSPPVSGSVKNGRKDLAAGELEWGLSATWPNFMERLGLKFPIFRTEVLARIAGLILPVLEQKIKDRSSRKKSETDSQVQTLQDSLKTENEKLTANQQQVRDLSSRLPGEVEKLTRFQQEIEAGIAALEKLRDAMARETLTPNGQAETGARTQAEQQLSEKDRRIAELEKELQSLRGPIEEAEARIGRIDQRIAALNILMNLLKTADNWPTTTAEQDAASRRIDELMTQLAALDKDLAAGAAIEVGKVTESTDRIKAAFAALFGAIRRYATMNCRHNATDQRCIVVLDDIARAGTKLRQLLADHGKLLRLIGDCTGSPLDCVQKAIATLEAEKQQLQQTAGSRERAREIENEIGTLKQERDQLSESLKTLRDQEQAVLTKLEDVRQSVSRAREDVISALSSFSSELKDVLSEEERALVNRLISEGGSFSITPEALAQIIANFNRRAAEFREKVEKENAQLQKALDDQKQLLTAIEELKTRIDTLNRQLESVLASHKKERILYRILFGRYEPTLLNFSDDPDLAGLAKGILGDKPLSTVDVTFEERYNNFISWGLPTLSLSEPLIVEEMEGRPVSPLTLAGIRETTNPGDPATFLIQLLGVSLGVGGSETVQGLFPDQTRILGLSRDRLDAVWNRILADLAGGGMMFSASVSNDIPDALKSSDVSTRLDIKLNESRFNIYVVDPKFGSGQDFLIIHTP